MKPQGTGTPGTVAITGVASRIGQAAAGRLLEQRWTMFGLDALHGRLDAAVVQVAAYHGRFRAIVCEVTDANRVVERGRQAAFIPPESP